MTMPENPLFLEVSALFNEAKEDLVPHPVELDWEIGHDTLVILRSQSARIAGFASSPSSGHIDEDDLHTVLGKFFSTFEHVEYAHPINISLTGKDIDTINLSFFDYAENDDSRIRNGILKKLKQLNDAYTSSVGIVRKGYSVFLKDHNIEG